jgi:beta-1,4-N-acetylglucosaminyltransferase
MGVTNFYIFVIKNFIIIIIMWLRAIVALACFALFRIAWHLFRAHTLGRRHRLAGKLERPIRTMVVLGSGGHTAEMLSILSKLSRDTYTPRTYCYAETDTHSSERVKRADECATLVSVPRSREVGQSFSSSVLTTLVAFYAAWPIVWRHRPQLLLVNGPGTCLPICIAAVLLRTLARRPCTIVYVESICRVRTLSLTAHMLRPFADRLFVQWQALARRYPFTEYHGRLS